MMSEQQQRIMGYFIEEAKDHLNTIEQGLLSLQSTIEDPEMVSEVFRAAHSVKGGAAMLGLNSIQMVSHRLEDFFKVLKECPIRVDQKLETLFLSVFDALKDLLDQLQGPFGLTDDKANEVMREVEPVFTALGEHLSLLVSQSGGTVPEEVQLSSMHTAPAATPAATPVPAKAQPQEVSALHLIFQSDVPARLRDMLQLFKQPETDSTRQQLQALCENLAQAGEQFDLPEWGELTDLARRAIANPENTYRTLAPVIIKDIKQAQERVLAGRASEIIASDSLKALVPAEPELSDSLDFADAFADLGFDSDVESAELLEFDLDSGNADFLEPASNALDPLQSTFIDDSTFVQSELPSGNFGLSADGEDSTVINLPETLDAASADAIADHNGPEVGIAELNSLADLFEGEVPDLGMTWQEEEVIGSVDSTRMSSEESNDAEDFSDLLFDQDGLDDLAPDSDEDDLSGLLGRSSASSDPLEALSLNELPELEPSFDPDAGEPPVTSLDLIDLDAVPSFEADELGNLFSDSPEINRDFEDVFGDEPALDESTLTEPFGDKGLADLDLAALEFADAAFPDASTADAGADDFAELDPLAVPDSGMPAEDAASSLGLFEDMAGDDALLENLFDDNQPESITTSEDWLDEQEGASASPEPELAAEPVSDPWGSLDEDITKVTNVAGAIAPPAPDTDLLADLWDDGSGPGESSDASFGAIDSLDDSDASDPFASLDLSDDLSSDLSADLSGDLSETAEFGDFAALDNSLETLELEPLAGLELSTADDPFAGFSDAEENPPVDTDGLLEAPLAAMEEIEEMEEIEAIAPVDSSTDSSTDAALLDLFDAEASDLTEDFGELEFNFGEPSTAADAELDSFAGSHDSDLSHLENNVASLDDLELELPMDGEPALATEESVDLGLDTPLGAGEFEEQGSDFDSDFNFEVGQTLTESLLELELSTAETPSAEEASLGSDSLDLEFLGAESSDLEFSGLEGELESLNLADELNDQFSLDAPADGLSGFSEFSESLTDSSLESSDFGDFGDLSAEETAGETAEETPALDFGEDTTDSGFESLSFDDLSFEEAAAETPALDALEGTTDSGLESLDFGDFSLAEMTAEAEEAEVPNFSEGFADGGLDSFELEGLALEENAEEPFSLDFSESVTDSGLESFDFGDFPQAESAENAEAASVSDLSEELTDGGLESLDFGDLSFETSPAESSSLDFSEGLTDSGFESLGFGDLSLEEMPAEMPAETPAEMSFAELDENLTDGGFESLNFDDLSPAETSQATSLDFSESDDDGGLESLNFDDFGLEESPQAVAMSSGDLDFGDLDGLVEQAEGQPSESDAGLDLDALSLGAEASASDSESAFDNAFDSFDLDGLLDEADQPVTDAGLDDLSDLDALLNDAEPAAPEAIASGFADDSDSFADLDALLGDSDPSPGPSAPDGGSAADDFADLDALLGGDEAMDIPPAPTPASAVSSNAAAMDEFGDLEKLLENADQTLGGVPTARGSRGSAMANPRRRAGGVLTDQTMRVSVKNLDNLNNLVGELVVNRNSLEQAEERLRQFLDNLLYQVQQLSDVGQRMRDLYERSLLESSLLSNRRSYQMSAPSSHGGDAPSNHATGASFDALEMDRFTGFHTLSQEMIELIVRVRESASDIDFVVEETDQITRNFRQITTQLQEGLTRSRMVPFAQTADRLPRAVRDISIKCGKQAELVIEGRETLIDKMILEQLYDPMTHLVNNAITHGIETADERMASGKDPTGKITVRTFHQGNQTVISVTDDGAGINPEIVKRKAVEKGLITQAQALEMSRLDIYDLLFHHGFSTRDKADDFAGRGVGMDVVRTSLNEIRGVVNIDSQIGRGTTFTIRLPLTLSISKALCCISNRARIAFPMDGVEDMLDVPKERVVRDDQDRPCIQWRDSLLPFQPLSDLLRYNRSLGRGSVYGGNQEEDIISVVVLRSAGNYIALQVDQVLGEQEIVIKQLEGPVPKPIGVAGATVLGDGRIMPIADVLELIDLSMGRIRRDVGSSLWEKDDVPPPVDPADNKTEPTVLIVDDSITVRELLSMTFQKVGYRVEQARDGQEAWEKLRSGLPCDLVFCDIEMPRMDGLELLSRLQKDTSLNHLPIAMLTSRGADRHRQMAVQLGAKGYFTKPYLEEALLDAAQRMLKGEVLVAGNG